MSRAIPVLIDQTAPPPIIHFNMFLGANIGQLKQQIIKYLKSKGFNWRASNCVMTVRFKGGGGMTVFNHDSLENWTRQPDFLAFQLIHHFRGGKKTRRKRKKRKKRKKTKRRRRKMKSRRK